VAGQSANLYIYLNKLNMQNTFTTVDQYIDKQAPDKQKILTQMRSIIKKAAPNADEVISYGMPAFKQNGTLVFYAVWKAHVGFYPSGSGVANFAGELGKYKTSKGAIQFPLSEPLPSDLIVKIVKFRVDENKEKAVRKAMAKKKK
jgi:uncharacterized protein YdhG (YjbR/CyaY superfamily)